MSNCIKKEIPCFLCDDKGNLLNPYESGSLSYTELTLPEKRPQVALQCPDGNTAIQHLVTVFLEGHLTYWVDQGTMSTPVSFRMIRHVHLYAPKGTALTFAVSRFQCCAVPCAWKDQMIEIKLTLDVVVHSQKNVSLLAPVVNDACCVIDRVCISADRIFDSTSFRCETCLFCKSYLLKAELCQYNALSNGAKSIYTDEDELKEYGDQGILSPDEVSCYNLFVNGVLQPKTTFRIEKGVLEFLTEDIPRKGEPISLVFLTYKDRCNQVLRAFHHCYNAKSDGAKKRFTNKDELKAYGIQGIPAPYETSWQNLYINGVLQPDSTYIVRKGVLELVTKDAPTEGAIITLESIYLYGWENQLIKSKISQFTARAKGQKIFTNKDELIAYGKHGIPDPRWSSFQNLYSNCVIQPAPCYMVSRGCLILKTEDAPTPTAPVTLQSARTIFTEATQSPCPGGGEDSAIFRADGLHLKQECTYVGGKIGAVSMPNRA